MEKKSTYEMDRNSELTIPTDWSNKSSDFSTIDSHSITDLPKKQPPSFDSSISLTRTQIWSGLVENSSRNTAQIQPKFKLATVHPYYDFILQRVGDLAQRPANDL